MSELQKFLEKNNIVPDAMMPLVHTTQSSNLKKIIKDNALAPATCDTFINEKVLYFFYGRHAYKDLVTQEEAEYWQLPTCFVLDYHVAPNPARVYPFDTGAMARKPPPFLASLFGSSDDMREKLQNFEARPSLSDCQRAVGAFYVNNVRYFLKKNRPRDELEKEFDLDAFDEEVKALNKLQSGEAGASRLDDRRATFEVQVRETVQLTSPTVLGVIMPAIYMERPDVVEAVETTWGAKMITYNHLPLRPADYTSEINTKVIELYLEKGIFTEEQLRAEKYYVR